VAALTITRDPAVARGDARVSFGAAGFRPRLGSGGTLAAPLTSGALRFRDLSIVRTGTLAMQGEATAQLELVFEEVAFDAAGINNPMLSNAHSAFYGATIANPAALGPGTFEHRIFRGVQADLNFATWEGWLTVGCALSRPGPTSRLATRSYSGAIWAYNMFLSPTTSAVLLHLGGSADVNGAAIVQNLVEFTSAAQVAVLRVSGDSDTGNNSHVVIHNNSFAGFFIQGRANIFYDDGPTPRSSRLQSCKGNIHVQINTKGDLFAADGTRTGNWAYLYGVGCRGEFSQFIDANTGGIGTSFAQAWPGQKAKIGTSATVRQDPLFVDYRGTNAGPTAGAGGGNYRLQAGSPAKAMLSTALLSHDLAGAARPALGDSAGAYA
jgi:hypothetical protein